MIYTSKLNQVKSLFKQIFNWGIINVNIFSYDISQFGPYIFVACRMLCNADEDIVQGNAGSNFATPDSRRLRTCMALLLGKVPQ